MPSISFPSRYRISRIASECCAEAGRTFCRYACLLLLTIVTSVVATACTSATEGADSALTPASGLHVGPGDNGLELRQWAIEDNPDRIAEAFRPWSSPVDDNTLLHEQLRRNGLRWTRVPIGELDALLTTLGGTDQYMLTWLGQPTSWVPTYRYRISERGQAIAVDGRLRRVADGVLRMLTRSWTVQTLDGPRMYLEIVPNFHHPTGKAPNPLASDRLKSNRRGQWYPSLAVHAELEGGYAYVLTGASPKSVWSDDETVIEQPPASDVLGPDAPAPATFGEMVFRRASEPPMRTVLVFIPRIPPGLNPPPLDESTDQRAAAQQDSEW